MVDPITLYLKIMRDADGKLVAAFRGSALAPGGEGHEIIGHQIIPGLKR